MASIAELEALLVRADAAAKAGDAEAADDARGIANLIVQMRGQAQIPGAAPDQVAPPEQPPELTAPGMAGAITRGAALPLAGAIGGTMVAGPPGAPLGAGVATVAPLVIDPVVEFVNRQFGTNYPTASQALQDVLTRMGVATPQTFVEKGTEAFTRAVGAGIAAPAGAARVVQTMVPAESTAARIAEAVRVGGMGPTGAGGMRGLPGVGTRAGAAATSGAIGAAAFEPTPESALTGGLLGPLAPATGAVLKTAGRTIWDSVLGRIVNPEVTAERALYSALGGTQESAKGALRALGEAQGVPVTPGMPRTLPEILMAGGVEPTVDLAALGVRLQRAGSPISDQVLAFQRDQLSALRQQLLQVNDQLRVPMLAPGRVQELENVRAGILARIEADEAILDTAARSSSEARLGTQPAGQAISVRAEQLASDLKTTLVQPAYKKAFDLAGDAPIDVAPITSAVERVLGRPLSEFDPATAPPIVRTLNRLIPRPAGPPAPAGAVAVPGQPIPGAPTVTTTLGVLDDMRKAINATIAQARRGNDQLAGIEVRNLMQLHSAIDNAIDAAPALSQEAKNAYRDALSSYRDLYAPRFREGETARILKPAMFGEMRIEPAQVVSKFLADADAADQFVRTFAGDPIAFSAMRSGIVETIREAALDGFTLSPKKLETFLADKAPILRRYENAGLNVGPAISRLEQEAAASKAAFDKLAAEKGPFLNKTPDDVLSYITSDPSRMKLALDRSDAAGKDAIQRVVAERLNKKLTDNPTAVLNELSDEQTRAAYRRALTPQLLDDFTERAKMGVAGREALKDVGLDDPAKYPTIINRANLTLPQLQGVLKVAQDDIARIRAVDQLASRAGATPRVGQITRDVTEEPIAAMPSSSMSVSMNAIVRTLANMEQRINRKVNAELARIIYNNPEAATVAIQNAIRRAERAAQPAGVTRAAPAAVGAMGEKIREVTFPPESQFQE